jgi:ferredoxin/coenzyme F420-reducing hydrogenase delta subunit
MQHKLTTAAPTRPGPALWLRSALTPVDWFFNRIYGSRWNPLYYSGALAIVFFLVLIVTGIYLFLFYKVAAPYDSVQAIAAQRWAGSWIRGLHRYAADAAIVAIVLHALKMFVAGRTWGPRFLAWVSGVVMVGVALICSWSGMIMVWDQQGYLVALEGARLLDLMPIFSEPISRAFVSQVSMPNSFIFMNLFLHVATPLGLAFLLWLHTSRVARPRLLPAKAAAFTAVGGLFAVALAHPPPILAKADLLELPGRVELDLLLDAFIPISQAVGPHWHLALWVAAFLAATSVPWWWKPRRAVMMPSLPDQDKCTGCTQCYEDCPYDAITMVRRAVPSKISETVAAVNNALCVSCGICAASCAPMVIAPPLRNGRDQLGRVQRLIKEAPPRAGEVILLGCASGLAAAGVAAKVEHVRPVPTDCSGSIHTSVIEYLVRAGAGGVYILSCPAEDCLNREGPQWLVERIYHDREAELKARVDRKRVRVGHFGNGELAAAVRDVAQFRDEVLHMAGAKAETDIVIDDLCRPTEAKA